MAFAAARMIMPKDKAQRKASSEYPGKGKVRFNFGFKIITRNRLVGNSRFYLSTLVFLCKHILCFLQHDFVL